MEKKTFQENGPKKQAGTAIYKYSKIDFNQKLTKIIGERRCIFLKGKKKKNHFRYPELISGSGGPGGLPVIAA